MFQFDCHAHVYETVTAIPTARYVPKNPAPLVLWQKRLEENGLNGGVIVQVSFLGTDNTQLCAALAQLDRTRFAGVAVVPLDVTDAELARLKRAGVRGLRWNLVRGAHIPHLKSPATQALFAKLRAHGLHLEIHLEGQRLAAVLPTLADQGVNLVVDHFGLPSEPVPGEDPLLRSLSTLFNRDNIFLKFSAHYRTPFDLRPHAQELLRMLGEDQIIWGSDWPHTQHESKTLNAEVHQMAPRWGCDNERQAIRTLFDLDGFAQCEPEDQFSEADVDAIQTDASKTT